MRARAYVLVTVGVSDADSFALNVKHIQIMPYPAAMLANDLVFEWFTMIGNSEGDARRNCIDSIAFYARCRPGMRDAILGALDRSCAAEVRAAIEAQT